MFRSELPVRVVRDMVRVGGPEKSLLNQGVVRVVRVVRVDSLAHVGARVSVRADTQAGAYTRVTRARVPDHVCFSGVK